MAKKSLRNKVAVVTGGARGIGLAIAERISADGAHVVIGDVQDDAGNMAARKLDALFVKVDLGRREDCQVLIDESNKTFGRVDILVNNAGFQHIDAIETFPENIWDKMVALMITAPFLLTKYVWTKMKSQGWGRIINISSIHGLVASPYKVGYISMKHALIGLTRTTALEGGAFGITANAVCPAYVRTPLVENQIADQARTRHIQEDEVLEKVMLEPAAIKRLIETTEVADVVSFLCSPSAGAITGIAFPIDLGWTAR